MNKTLSVYGYLIRGETYDMPYIESIQSVMGIASEVVIATDPKFNDGTIERIEALGNSKIKLIKDEGHDWQVAWQDGYWKNIARKQCQGDILMQLDLDEVLRPEDEPKIQKLVTNWDKNMQIVAAGVINWFNGEHFKLDAAGWKKERFSINSEHIEHGIPVQFRVDEGNGYYHAEPNSTDGAAYLDKEGGFSYSADTLLCDPENLPNDIHSPDSIYLHHYAWYSLPRKWEMKCQWHYMWGRLFGRYKNLDDYKTNMDGEPVNFWGPPQRKPSIQYREAITNEMKDKSIIKVTNVEHPDIMSKWIQRQVVYTPGKWYRKEMMKNMEKRAYK